MIQYRQAIASHRADRRKQLLDFSTLISDPEYYAARHELHVLSQRNPRGFIGGTDDYRRMEELTKIMEEIATELLP